VARRSAPRPNENREYIEPVLGRVSLLRRAYSRASRDDFAGCDDALRELVSLLEDPDTANIIDAELARRQRSPELTRVASNRELVKREADLARDFGFKPREARRYIKRGREERDTPLPDVGSTADLVVLINEIHADLRQAISAEGPPWKRWPAVRRGRAEAEARVFGVGAIVADTMRRPLFHLSYAVGVTWLRRTVA
jgi:hypothetical protein